MNSIEIQHIVFEGFDHDKEMQIEYDTGEYTMNKWLSPNEVNRLITFLSEQLQLVGEPVDILKTNEKL